MFWLMLMGGWTLLHAYVFWRAGTVPWIVRRVPRRAVWAGGAVLWASYLPMRWIGSAGTGRVAVSAELAGMDWLATLFLMATCLLAVDVITLFGVLFRKRAPVLRGVALAAGLLMAVTAVVQGLRAPVVDDYEVRLAGLPKALDGTVVVGLSDLHLGSLLGEKWMEARAGQVEALHPDMIVLLGDMVEGHGADPKRFLDGFRRLRAPLGVWAVTGNHESHGGQSKGLSVIEEAGATVLHDRWAQVRPGLIVAGVDDLGSRRRGTAPPAQWIRKALDGRPPGATLLLSHTPIGTREAASLGTGLMLCGHTHGGQVWPFGLVAALKYPLLAGPYAVDGMTVLVCRGTGTWGPRMRLWHPGEIMRITLRSAP